MRVPGVVIAILAAAGCGLFEPDSRRVIGLIGPDLFTIPTIESPDTVPQGVEFSATINTFGSSSCHTPDGVRLTLGPSEARVIPYDRVRTGDDVACTPDLMPIPHPVELRFTEPGAATIVVVGVVFAPSGGLARDTVTKSVVVIP